MKLKTMGRDGISINRDTIDVRYVEQLADTEQLAALAYFLKYAELHVFNGKRTLRESVSLLMEVCGGARTCRGDGEQLCAVRAGNAEGTGDFCMHQPLQKNQFVGKGTENVSDKANIAAAVLAHGCWKTTLSEALLYESGMIRRAGRVDNKDAFLDTFALEKERGITIFSTGGMKAAGGDGHAFDTPGHVDFSGGDGADVYVLDYAILVISGADGVQAHTRTLFVSSAGMRCRCFCS